VDDPGATTRVRRLLILGVVGFTVLTVFIVIRSSAATDCTSIGSEGRDIITGGTGRQVICLKGERDYGHGQGGNDVLRGGPASDTLIGGKGADKLKGAKGGDRLFAVDGQPGDVLKGGAGKDHCYGDKGDTMSGCEDAHRGPTLQESKALQSEFAQVMILAEEQIPGPPPGPVTPPTPFGTRPDCVSPPTSPPPNCF
jgi:RTX calcium-binding nonapeptide repeat (4 copies)